MKLLVRDFLAKHKAEHDCDCEVRDKRLPVETLYVGSHIYSSKRIHLTCVVCTYMSGICELVKIAIFKKKTKLHHCTEYGNNSV